mgnify:CR=1 FL=1
MKLKTTHGNSLLFLVSFYKDLVQKEILIEGSAGYKRYQQLENKLKRKRMGYHIGY